MLKTLSKIIATGTVTENFELLGDKCKQIIDERFSGSIAIRHVNAGSCNACELEIHTLNNAFYNIECFGIHFVSSPRHADLLLVTGPVSRHMESALINVYNATPNPKIVIAAGDCGVCGGEFGCSYACAGAVKNVIPVDGIIKGCPLDSIELLAGILQVLKK